MAGLQHFQDRDYLPLATQQGGSPPSQPPVLGPFMGALREQRACIEDAIDVIHTSINHPGQDWQTRIPWLQCTLRKTLTEHMESIKLLEAFMLTEGLGCWSVLEMVQLDGDYLVELANVTIRLANSHLWDMEYLVLPAEDEATLPEPMMEDNCPAGLDPTHNVARDNLQVKNEHHKTRDTAVYPPVGAVETWMALTTGQQPAVETVTQMPQQIAADDEAPQPEPMMEVNCLAVLDSTHDVDKATLQVKNEHHKTQDTAVYPPVGAAEQWVAPNHRHLPVVETETRVPQQIGADTKQQAAQAEVTSVADDVRDRPALQTAAKATLQVKDEHVTIDTAVYSPPGPEEIISSTQSSHQILDRCLAEALAVGRKLDKLSALHTGGTKPKMEILTRDDTTSLQSQNPRMQLDIALARAASLHQKLDKLTMKESSRRESNKPEGQASNLEAQPVARATDHPDQPAGSTNGQTAQLAVPLRQTSNKEVSNRQTM